MKETLLTMKSLQYLVTMNYPTIKLLKEFKFINLFGHLYFSYSKYFNKVKSIKTYLII